MREYRVNWDGTNPDDARPALAGEPVESSLLDVRGPDEGPQMGEQVIVRDSRGRAWPARVGWDLRLGWVLVPQPAWGEPDDLDRDDLEPDGELVELS